MFWNIVEKIEKPLSISGATLQVSRLPPERELQNPSQLVRPTVREAIIRPLKSPACRS